MIILTTLYNIDTKGNARHWTIMVDGNKYYNIIKENMIFKLGLTIFLLKTEYPMTKVNQMPH